MRTCEHNRHRNTLRAIKRIWQAFKRRKGYITDISHPQRIRRKFLKKVLAQAKVQKVDSKVEVLRHARPAWTGVRAPRSNDKRKGHLPLYEEREYSVEELVERGFEIVHWDGT